MLNSDGGKLATEAGVGGWLQRVGWEAGYRGWDGRLATKGRWEAGYRDCVTMTLQVDLLLQWYYKSALTVFIISDIYSWFWSCV